MRAGEQLAASIFKPDGRQQQRSLLCIVDNGLYTAQ